MSPVLGNWVPTPIEMLSHFSYYLPEKAIDEDFLMSKTSYIMLNNLTNISMSSFPQGGRRLLGNPSGKASEFLRAVFDAPEVGITTRNVEKVTIMP
jgi:hypothetical protein